MLELPESAAIARQVNDTVRGRTIVRTAAKPCPVCGAEIQKTAYLGGAVYWCPVCQPEV